MLKFITRIFLFISAVLVVMGVIYLYNVSKLDDRKEIKGHILIAGDSHVNKGINPEAIPGSVNIAQTAEPLYLTYFKLRKLLPDNPQVDTLILGYGIHNLSVFNDKKLIDAKWSATMFDRMYPLIDLKDLEDLEVEKQKYYKSFIRNMLLIPKSKHIKYVGDYVKGDYFLDRANPDDIIQQHYFYREKLAGTSKTQLDYLNKIILLCSGRKIYLVLVNLPTHKKYQALIPKIYKDYYEQVNQSFDTSRIRLLDYSSQNLTDSLFMDYDHLNFKGALLISQKLYQDIH